MSDPRTKWLAMLASLTYPASPGQAAEAFQPYLPLLRDLPAAAFTQRSLEAVASAPRKMAIPSFDEVRKPLAAWWKDHRPSPRALPEPLPTKRDPPTDEEIAAVREAVAGLVAELQVPDPKSTPKLRSLVLSDEALLVAYEQLAKQDTPASAAAQVRVDMLRAKLGHRERETEREPEHEDA